MAVGTQVRRWQEETVVRPSRTRRWIAAAAIAIAAAGAGTGIIIATTGTDGATPAVSSPEVTYVDPGVEARQDALKRFHQDARPVAPATTQQVSTGSDPQSALKRYHEDNLGR